MRHPGDEAELHSHWLRDIADQLHGIKFQLILISFQLAVFVLWRIFG